MVSDRKWLPVQTRRNLRLEPRAAHAAAGRIFWCGALTHFQGQNPLIETSGTKCCGVLHQQPHEAEKEIYFRTRSKKLVQFVENIVIRLGIGSYMAGTDMCVPVYDFARRHRQTKQKHVEAGIE
jgi:hypothetical protein